MALVANTDGYSQVIGAVEMLGSFDGANPSLDPPNHQGWFQWGYGNFGNETSHTQFPRDAESGAFSRVVTVDKDKTMKFRALARDEDGDVNGPSSGNFLTYADIPTFTGLTPGTPTTVTCPVTGSVVPKTTESTGSVTIQFRVQGTTNWSETGIIANNISGNASVALSGTIYGLSPGVTYEARFKIDRTTTNDPTSYSNIGTFTTPGAVATIVGAVTMNYSWQMMVPVLPTGLIILAPVFEDTVWQMMVPFISTTDRTRITGVLVTISTVIERTIEISE